MPKQRPGDRAGETSGSVDNTLRLLVLLGERRSLRVFEAAEVLGVARSTAHRLLSALHRRGFAVQDAHRVYRPGPVFAQLGLAPTATRGLVLAAHPLLEELRAHTGESCHLVVLEGNGARFVDGVESPRQLRVASKIGLLVPAHTNSAGKALLAELSPASFAALYPRGVPGAIGTAMENLRALQQELDRVRRRGYATNFDESEQGITAIGAVVRTDSGRPVAGLAVAVPSSRCPRTGVKGLADTVREVAAKGLPVVPESRSG